MKDKTPLAYEDLSSAEQFRENYRYIFSVAVIATVFVVPTDNILSVSLKWVLGFSASFAALYLIASAARVKYEDPGRMYEVFYISERFRTKMFDWSIDFFGAAFLFFIGLMITGAIESIPGVELDNVWVLVVLGTAIVAVIAILLSVEMYVQSKKRKNKKVAKT